MTPHWVIRQARLDDAEGFVRAHEAAWDAVGVVEKRLGELVSFEDRVAMFEASLAKVSHDARAWVAERSEEIVGLAVCRREGAEAIELRDLYVVPSAWGSGVAKALMDTALEAMREAGVREALLWVGEENSRARRFYEREGWTADGASRASQLGPIEVRYRLAL